ncbi:MAG: hypothetical protein J6U21_01885, partial [Bacteroidales bacterium]|nr:hypothetical protein [Bacteroidales bacterium]
MKRLILITTIILMSCAASEAQLETAVWYFGRNAGLDFNTPEPKVLTDGKITDLYIEFDTINAHDDDEHHRLFGEGMATFSDSLGHLRLYTNGQTLWNANGDIMPNGE